MQATQNRQKQVCNLGTVRQYFSTQDLIRVICRLGANDLLFTATDRSTEVGDHNGSSSQQRQQHDILHGMAQGVVELLQATSHGDGARDQQHVRQQGAACLQTSQAPWCLQCKSPFTLEPTKKHPQPSVHNSKGWAFVCLHSSAVQANMMCSFGRRQTIKITAENAIIKRPAERKEKTTVGSVIEENPHG